MLNAPFATCPAICLQEDLAASAGGDDAFEAYCAELEGTAAWGGQVELQVGLGASSEAPPVVRCALAASSERAQPAGSGSQVGLQVGVSAASAPASRLQ